MSKKVIEFNESIGTSTPIAVLKGHTFSSDTGFNQVGIFEPTADNISYNNSESKLESTNIQSAITELSNNDDFTHIPLVVCETSGDQPIKEITIPGYTEEKFPIIALRFSNNNTSTEDLKLKINGEHEYYLRTGNQTPLNYTEYPFVNWNTYLFAKAPDMQMFRLINGVDKATTRYPGIVQLTGSLSSSSTAYALTAGAGKALNDKIDTALLPYNSTRSYPINTLVIQDGAIYKSLQNDNLNHPLTDTAWWMQLTRNILVQEGSLPDAAADGDICIVL